MSKEEGNYYVEFIHREMPNQQVCQQYFHAESLEEARDYVNNLDYVGLVLYLNTTTEMRKQSNIKLEIR